jgi:hypothetical protein
MVKKYIIVDIDGTISKVGDRLKYLKESPKDWDAFYDSCFDDEPINEIIDLVECLECDPKHIIVFCTGRRESCRPATELWIAKHFYKTFKYKGLIMRPNNDIRDDTLCKIDQLRQRVDFKDIKFVLEDRNSMVEKWRELGVKCLQVAEGDF